MPEGPEVKIASSYYNQFFEKTSHIKFEILTEYYEKKYTHVFDHVNHHINEEFSPLFTIGKNLFLPLKNDDFFNFHLGMTGCWSNSLEKHCHFRVFSGTKELFFKDVRKFGKMKILSSIDFSEKHHKEYDLLHQDYNFDEHIQYLFKTVGQKQSISSVIMNQSFFPGVGNYIKSEALYSSRIHPEKKWKTLSKKKIKTLVINTQKIMKKSYINGGAELKDFKNPMTNSTFTLQVYGKLIDPFGNQVVSAITSDQRKSWFCPKLQK